MRKENVSGDLLPLNEVKVLQMDVLQAVDMFCRENEITYSLACGTMLGAVRHKGYIPWDDDIDIYMLRKEYDKFVALFPNKYKSRYCVASLETSRRWDRPYAKVYDSGTLLVEQAKQSEIIGVNIDLYPIDDVPDDAGKWAKFNKKRLFMQRLLVAKSLKYRKNRGVVKNTKVLLMQIILCPFGRRFISRLIDRYIKSNNGKGYGKVFECSQGLGVVRPFEKNIFRQMCDYAFEDRTFKGFMDADTYLKSAYGNYMQLPPEEKRVAHHDYVAYWLNK